MQGDEHYHRYGAHRARSRRGLAVTLCALALQVNGCGTLLDPNRAVDSDGDGLSDQRERLLGMDPATADTDGDGVRDGAEMEAGTSPLAADSDRDGIPDGDDRANEPSRRFGSASSGNDVEPNDNFERAVVLTNTGNDARTFEGSIDRVDDLDVFDLGPLGPGDRVRVEFRRRDEGFLPSVALFDDSGSVIDARLLLDGASRSDRVQLINEVVRHGSGTCFLAISHTPDDDTLGRYRLDVSVTRGEEVPPPNGQMILLDFDGGVLDPPILGFSAILPFDAALIDNAYAADTETIKRSILDTVVRNFAGWNVTVVTTDDPPILDGGPITTLRLGSLSDSALGAAQAVDPYNAESCDDGVVFAESFSPSTFGIQPSAEAVGVAIGNVASHEAGHLLGLRHVADPRALMDESSPPIHLLFDQTFKIAPLANSVFPIGWQDAPLLLSETVGLR